MTKRLFLTVLCLLLLQSAYPSDLDKKAGLFIEFDQMLSLKLGLDVMLNDDWGIRGALGSGIPPGGTFTWNLLGYYRFTSPGNLWKFDLEFGIPMAYFNFLEGIYIDKAPYVDGPFHGYIAGFSFRAGRQTKIGLFALRLGGGLWSENQSDSGWKSPRFMPVVSLIYGFTYPD